MTAIMEKRAREIFREALLTHYIIELPCPCGDQVELWLKTHGGWFPNEQDDYGYGSLMPLMDDPDVTSKEPKQALQDANDIMKLIWPTLNEGDAELVDQMRNWIMQFTAEQIAKASVETPQGTRARSRSPRRCVIPQMTVAVLKETIQLKDQLIETLQGKIKDANHKSSRMLIVSPTWKPQ